MKIKFNDASGNWECVPDDVVILPTGSSNVIGMDWGSDTTEDESFAIGDVVNLIVGDGPDMVVISTCECGTVEVAWIQPDGTVMVDVFPEEVLV